VSICHVRGPSTPCQGAAGTTAIGAASAGRSAVSKAGAEERETLDEAVRLMARLSEL
jgi:hypothetical protein